MPVPATIWDLLCYENVIAGASDDFDWPDFDEDTIASLCRMAGRADEPDSTCSALLPAVAACLPDGLHQRSQEIVLSAQAAAMKYDGVRPETLDIFLEG